MNTELNSPLNAQTEDLLVKYMDGTLSEAEQEDFDGLLLTNPTFAEEVRAVAQFDEFLDAAPLAARWSSRVDTAFLGGMQQQLAHVVASGAATTLAGSAVASGIATKSATSVSATTAGAIATKTIIATSLWTKTLIVAALVGTVGVGVWKYRASTEVAPNLPSEQTAQSADNRTIVASAQESSNQAPSVDAAAAKPSMQSNHIGQKEAAPKQITAQTSENAEAQAPANQAPTPAPEQEARANASIEREDRQREVVEQLQQLLRNYEQTGDNVSAAFTMKRLGMVARQAGHFEEGNAYFAKALKSAQNLKLKELEGEVRAEQAVLYRATGNTEQALSALREAVKILTEASSTTLAKWTKQLEQWEKK
jgi:tetratricopeptide (TPR) repeat protein